jgi:hypothetical protein
MYCKSYQMNLEQNVALRGLPMAYVFSPLG